jgi:hypothetical protein
MPKLALNAIGAFGTSAALVVMVVSKFTHGAWITAVVIPLLVVLFRSVRHYRDRLAALRKAEGPLETGDLMPPIVIIPLRRLDQIGRKALRFALAISPNVQVVQILAEELDTEDLKTHWHELVEAPVGRSGRVPPPKLIVLRSPYRQFFERFNDWLHHVTTANPGRQVIVLIPELVQRRWYHIFVSHRALRLKAELLMHGGPQVSVMSTPWYADRAAGHSNP